MKTRVSSTMAGLMVVLCVLALSWGVAAQKPAAADVLLGQALHQEQNEGRLQDAIATYAKVLAAPDATRAQKARAQFRIGACYEKLGAAQAAEARKAYEAVVATYGDQSEFAAQAKARLGALGAAAGAAAAARPGGPTTRLLWSKPGWISMDLSPDGRSVAFIDEATANLWVRDIATGTDRQLTKIPADRVWSEFPLGMAWSPDGTRLAFSWYVIDPKSDTSEIRIVDVKTGAVSTFEQSRKLEATDPGGWAPDGSRLLVYLNAEQSAWLTPANGSVVPIAGVKGAALVSPDGTFIVAGSRTLEHRPDSDIFIANADGASLRLLLGGPGDDSPLAWTPDGTRLLLRSHRAGVDGVWLLRVEKGATVGEPELLSGVPTGVESLARTGALLYSTGTGQSDLHAATLDVAGGRVVEPSSLMVPGGTRPWRSPEWSPDGTRLAYICQFRDRQDRPILVVAAGDGSSPRVMTPEFTPSAWMHLTWTRDSRALFVGGYEERMKIGLYRVDADTGAAVRLGAPLPATQPDGVDIMPITASQDGKTLFLLKNHKRPPVFSIWARDVETGAEKELYRSPALMRSFPGQLSPDGTRLAFMMVPSVGKNAQLMTVPVAGGPPVVICKQGSFGASIAWTADGKSLLFGQPRGDRATTDSDVWLVSAEGGEPRNLGISHPLVMGIAAHPDGKRLAWIGMTRASQEVWLMEHFLPPAKK